MKIPFSLALDELNPAFSSQHSILKVTTSSSKSNISKMK